MCSSWQPLNRLFALDPSQTDLFQSLEARKDFIDQYRLLTSAGSDTRLEAFRPKIMQDSRRYTGAVGAGSTPKRPPCRLEAPRAARRIRGNPREVSRTGADSFFIVDDDDDNRDDFRDSLVHARGVNLAQNFHLAGQSSTGGNTTHPGGISVRSGANHDASQNAASFSLTTANRTPRTRASTPPAAVVKPEPQNVPTYLLNVPESSKVKIYVGTSTQHFTVLREDLTNSSVLSSWVTETENGAFIMRPELLDTRKDDFRVITHYMHSKECALSSTENQSDLTGPKIRDKSAVKDHSAQLVCAGRYYVLAQRFQVKDMPVTIYNKITSVDASYFDTKSLISLATVLFEDRRESPPSPPDTSAVDGASTPGAVDDLEAWVVDRIASSFKEIMWTEQSLFWQMEAVTRKRRLAAKILTAASALYEAAGRVNESVIELE